MLSKITSSLSKMSNRQIVVTVIFYILLLLLIWFLASKGSKVLKDIFFKITNPARTTDGSSGVSQDRLPVLDSLVTKYVEAIDCWFCTKDSLTQANLEFSSLVDSEAIWVAKKFKAVKGSSLYTELSGETDFSAVNGWTLGLASYLFTDYNNSQHETAYASAMSKLSQINMAN